MKEMYKKYINEDPKFDKATMVGIFCLIIVLAGIFGFIYEYIFYYFNGGMTEFYWRGGNFLPWINIYAYGAILIYLVTFKYRKKSLKVFILSLVVCGLLEFLSGYIFYTFFGGWRGWNYNNEILNFGNIGGFVCLRSVLFFGLSGLLLIYCILPCCFYLASKLNKKVFLTIAIVLISVILIDDLYNLIVARIIHTPRAPEVYKSIGIHYIDY